MKNLGKRFSLMALACAMALGFSVGAQAAGADDYPVYGPQLTQEQAAKMQKIFNDNYTQMDGTRKALTAKRAALDAELASLTPDKAKIESLSREIGELRGQMLSARAAVRSQLESQGLPTDFYAPNPGYDTPPPPPDGWYHGRGRHHGMMRGGWGCWGGCW